MFTTKHRILGVLAAFSVAMFTLVATASATDYSRMSKQAEAMSLSGNYTIINGSDDSGSTVRFNTNTAEAWDGGELISGSYNQIHLRGKGTDCGGWPIATVYVSGTALFSEYINSTVMHTTISTFARRSGGTFTLEINYPNGGGLACSDLYVDYIKAVDHY